MTFGPRYQIILTQCRCVGPVVATSASYSGGSTFNYRRGGHYPDSGYSRFSAAPPDCFLSDPSQCIGISYYVTELKILHLSYGSILK
jgi:hypothetical protein